MGNMFIWKQVTTWLSMLTLKWALPNSKARFPTLGTKICLFLCFSEKIVIVVTIIYCLACQENLFWIPAERRMKYLLDFQNRVYFTLLPWNCVGWNNSWQLSWWSRTNYNKLYLSPVSVIFSVNFFHWISKHCGHRAILQEFWYKTVIICMQCKRKDG